MSRGDRERPHREPPFPESMLAMSSGRVALRRKRMAQQVSQRGRLLLCWADQEPPDDVRFRVPVHPCSI
jgi:hypothetical protein